MADAHLGVVVMAEPGTYPVRVGTVPAFLLVAYLVFGVVAR
jgi:hypothetical protein